MSKLLLTFAICDGTGASIMLLEYAKALVDQGHEVLLAHGTTAGDSGRLPQAGQRCLEELADHGVRLVPCDGFRSLFSRQLQTQLETLVRTESIESVIGFQQLDRKYALSVANKTGIPCIITALNKHTFWGPKPVAWAKRFVYKRLLRQHASLVICSSQEVEREIHQEFGISNRKTKLIPNGLQMHAELLSGQVGEDVRASLHIPSNAVVLCNIARIDVQKGQDLLLEALAQLQAEQPGWLPDWRLLLVGDVSAGKNSERMQAYKAQLESTVQTHGLAERVSFLGWRDDVRELLTASDIYVHPSRWEGFPLAIIHAMGEAKPIVASDCVGAPIGFETGEHGFVFASESIEALKTALASVFNHNDWEKMGTRCRQLALENYDIAVLNRQFVEAVETTIRQVKPTTE